MSIEVVNEIIQTRRSVYPLQYIEKEIPDAIITQALVNANTAPTHRLTQPWRFKVLKGDVQKRLGIFMAEKYRSANVGESFSVAKYEKLKMNPQRAGAVVLVCMKRDEKNRVPEWEEIAAVSMAVQNMWLTCRAYDVGAYWSTPGVIGELGEFVPFEAGERCLGLFYMGYFATKNPLKSPPKQAMEDVVQWID